ncbi:hypothetical protein U1Q18_048623 [Sarracenia purpurea var. burkii]
MIGINSADGCGGKDGGEVSCALHGNQPFCEVRRARASSDGGGGGNSGERHLNPLVLAAAGRNVAKRATFGPVALTSFAKMVGLRL